MIEPWKQSAHTKIWNVTEKAREVSPVAHPADDAALAVWLVHAPWMHLAWSWHYVGLIHLRDLPGQSKPPTLKFRGATHELFVCAVSPDIKVDPATCAGLRFLTPASIVQQFTAEDDAIALTTVEKLLQLCTCGSLTLDSDGRKAWSRLLGPTS